MKYKHLVLGGTFDLLHKGHEKFLISAFKNAKRVTIGLTSDVMASRKDGLFQNYEIRKAKIVKFLKSKKFTNWQIESIDDPFGTAITDESMDAILVSSETASGGKMINKRRKALGLKLLEIILLKTILADDGKKISSGRIKRGEINRNGMSFLQRLNQSERYLLPQYLRPKFAKPLGPLHANIEQLIAGKVDLKNLFVVGDVSVVNFLKLGIMPNLSIIDFRVQRKKVYEKIEDLGLNKGQKYQSAENAAGEITRDLIIAVGKNLAGDANIIKVEGEEDLAVLPVVLLAPLGSLVVYGQRNRGIVSIYVSEEKKVQFLKILASLK